MNKKLIWIITILVMLAFLLIWKFNDIFTLSPISLKDEGIFFYIRVFAPIIGAILGGVITYKVAMLSFEKTRKKELEKEEKKKEILKKKLLYTLSLIIQSAYLGYLHIIKNEAIIKKNIAEELVTSLDYDILGIPSELILSIPESELFEILIEDNGINDYTIIRTYNIFYSSISRIENLKKTISGIYESTSIILDRLINGLNETNLKLFNLQKEYTALDLNIYWKKHSGGWPNKKSITKEDAEELLNILEIESNKEVNKKIKKEIENITVFMRNYYSGYFDSLNQHLKNFSHNKNVLFQMIYTVNFVLQNCFSAKEYQMHLDFLIASTGINISNYRKEFED